MTYDKIPLHVNKTEHRFEMIVENDIAFIDYKQSGQKMYLIHTEVPAALEGKGVASALVEKTLTYLQENQLTMVPLCAFVKSYIEKHPEWQQLIEREEN